MIQTMFGTPILDHHSPTFVILFLICCRGPIPSMDESRRSSRLFERPRNIMWRGLSTPSIMQLNMHGETVTISKFQNGQLSTMSRANKYEDGMRHWFISTTQKKVSCMLCYNGYHKERSIQKRNNNLTWVIRILHSFRPTLISCGKYIPARIKMKYKHPLW